MRAMKKIGLVLLAIVISGVVYNIWFVIQDRRVVKKSVACMDNLKVLDMAISAYVQDHNKYPGKLSDLYPKYVTKLDLFVCPGKPMSISSPKDIDSQSGYVLLFPSGTTFGISSNRHGSVYRMDDPERPLLSDRRTNHLAPSGEPWGSWVLYCDGHCEWRRDTRATERFGKYPYTFDFPE